MKIESVKWWHFWNPWSGAPGGIIAAMLIATGIAAYYAIKAWWLT